MKKTVALILMACVLCSLCSCALVRKIEPSDTAAEPEAEPVDSQVDTDFPETEEDPAAEDIRYTEDEAMTLLEAAYSADGENKPVITKTGDMTAQSNGTEYYIFNVEYPKTEADSEAEDGAEADSESEQEAPEGPVTVYVSTNGGIYETLEEENTTVLLAGATYTVKHGDKDEATGYAYRVEYQGLVKNLDMYCYNYIVYLEDDSSGTVNSVYKTNYLVTLDGKSSGEQKLQ